MDGEKAGMEKESLIGLIEFAGMERRKKSEG